MHFQMERSHVFCFVDNNVSMLNFEIKQLSTIPEDKEHGNIDTTSVEEQILKTKEEEQKNEKPNVTHSFVFFNVFALCDYFENNIFFSNSLGNLTLYYFPIGR